MGTPAEIFELLLNQKFDDAELSADCPLQDLARKLFLLDDNTSFYPAEYLVKYGSASAIRAFHARVGCAPFLANANVNGNPYGFPIWHAIGRDVDVFKAALDAMEGRSKHSLKETAYKCVRMNYAPGLDALAPFLSEAFSPFPFVVADWRVPLITDTVLSDVCLPLQRVLIEQLRAENSERLDWLADFMIKNNCLPLLDAIGCVKKARPTVFTSLLRSAATFDWPATAMIRALIMRYGFWDTAFEYLQLNVVAAGRARALMRVVRETKNVVLVLTLKCCNKRKRLFLPEELTEYFFLEFM